MASMGKKVIYYIGFYEGRICSERRRNNGNMAGTVYMDGLINLLRGIGYHVILVSLQYAANAGVYAQEHIVVNDGVEQYFLPYLSIKIGKRMMGGRTVISSLEHFIYKHIKADDIVISYHSLVYKNVITEAHHKIGFTWIPEINELYCLSRQEYANPLLLDSEISMFSEGDGYIFANDILAQKYANNKPYTILYGNYDINIEKKQLPTEKIKLVYTGIINEDRGVFKIIQTMECLPDNYTLHILGFGSENNMKRLLREIDLINRKHGEERVYFYGTKVGKDYSNFLSDKHIGVSLISQNEDICNNAFPGKILSYMGHSLYVLSSKCDSICNSRLGEYIYYCENTTDSIADAIKRIPVFNECNSSKILEQLGYEFQTEFKQMMCKLQETSYEKSSIN